MPELSERLRRYAVSAPVGEIERETLSLFHPAWETPYHFTTHVDPFEGEVRGQLVTFTPHLFQARLPKRDGEGRFDMAIDLAIGGPGFVEALMAARPTLTAPQTRIEAEYNVYLPGDVTPQDVSLLLELTQIAAQGETLTGRARFYGWLSGRFPREIYRLDRFRGLDR